MKLAAFVPWSLFFSLSSQSLQDGRLLHVRLGHPCTQTGTELQVKLARSESARIKGLSGVRKLGHGEGMLFLFEQPAEVRFWMKDTLIPLQIGFFRPDATLIRAENMGVEPNPSEPVKVYPSGGLTKLVLETNPGEMGLPQGQAAELCVRSERHDGSDPAQ